MWTIILPAVGYGCEIWFLTLREEPRLRVSDNRVLKKIFVLKRDEVKGGWRKLHNKGLHNLYSSPSVIRIIRSRRVRWAGHVARMGEKRNVHRLLVEKPEGKRPLGRPRCRWTNNINMDPIDRIVWCGLDWTGSGWGQMESYFKHGNERSGSIKCWETILWLHNWRALK
jgi:hypothetical protein